MAGSCPLSCHLGTGGSSVAAVDGGCSVETSMGLTPPPGLIMSTRSGDVDPAVVLALIREHGYTPEAVDRLLNRESGLIGVSSASSDLLELMIARGSGCWGPQRLRPAAPAGSGCRRCPQTSPR